MLVLIACGQGVSPALKGALAAVVEMASVVFPCGRVVSYKGLRQPGHAGHGIEYWSCTYRWAEDFALSP